MRTVAKICLRCGQEYFPASNGQKYCPDCAPIERKEYGSHYRHEHHDARLAYGVIWRNAHRSEIHEYAVQHKEEAHINKVWYQETHRDALCERQEQYRHEHPEHLATWRHANSTRVAQYTRTEAAKRRVLGFIPLNQPFYGCDGHHTDKEHIVYIPTELHQSVYHNVWTGKNMARINALVDEWLAKENE